MVAGFQGSETSSVEVTFYRQTGDPVSKHFGVDGNTVIKLIGKVREDPDHSIIGLQTNKLMGPSAGNWTLSLKPSADAEDLFRTLNDDDWCDISMLRHGLKWHIFRGLVDDIRKGTSVAGSGATSKTYTVMGRDHTKVLEQTPMFQDVYARSEESLGAFLPNRIFRNTDSDSLDGVAHMVERAITGYLQSENDTEGRTSWILPKSMPRTSGFFGNDNSFINSVWFWTDNYKNDPPRLLTGNHWVSAQGMLWPWLTERSDPLLTDMWTDIIPGGVSFGTQKFSAELLEKGLRVQDSEMAIIVRDKPFPRTDTRLDGPWFSELGLFIVPREQIVNSDIGKTGYERFNAFFLAPIIMGHEDKNYSPLVSLAPTWSEGEINRHGMRRFDTQTIWIPNFPKVGWAEYQEKYRLLLRDFHALNPYMLNGTMNLGIGRPDIRVGHRVRIPGQVGESDQETYYVEGVSHEWSYGRGAKTTLSVTRGWIGTDSSLLSALDAVTASYADAKLSRATT